jgi:hypothetical protein
MAVNSENLKFLSSQRLKRSALSPSENWHRENLSENEFIGVKRCRPEDLQCESEI